VLKYIKETLSLDLSVVFVKVFISSDSVITLNDILRKHSNRSTLLGFKEISHETVINVFDYVITHNDILMKS